MFAEIKNAFIPYKQVYVLSLLFIAVNALFIAFEIYWFVGVPFVLALTYLALKALDKFVLLIVFLTPLSVPLELYFPGLGFNLQLLTEPLLICVLLIFTYRIILERNFDRQLLLHPISVIIYAQLIWLLITSITSSMPMVSFKFLISRLWFLVAFYFVALLMFQRKSMIRKYLWMYLPAMLFVVVYAIINLVQLGLFNQKGAHTAANPFFNDHTSYGAILAMLIPVVAALGSMKKYSLPFKAFTWLIFTMLCFALLFSYTRAAWLSIFAVTAVFLVIKSGIPLKLIGLFTIAAAGIIFMYRTDIFLKLEQNRQDSSKDISKHLESVSNIRTDASNLERINRWNSAFRMYHERSVLGWGPGTYMFQYAPFQVSHQKTIISTNLGDWGNAHSEYIGPLAESGFPGMVIMIVLVIFSLYTGFKVYFSSEPYTQERILSLALTLGLMTYYIHGTLNNFLDTDKASALVWGYTAMIVAMDVKRRRALKYSPEN